MTVTSASWPSVAVTVMRWPGSTFFSPEGWAAMVARDCSDGTTVWKSTLADGGAGARHEHRAAYADRPSRRDGMGTRSPGGAVEVLTGYGTSPLGLCTEGSHDAHEPREREARRGW